MMQHNRPSTRTVTGPAASRESVREFSEALSHEWLLTFFTMSVGRACAWCELQKISLSPMVPEILCTKKEAELIVKAELCVSRVLIASASILPHRC